MFMDSEELMGSKTRRFEVDYCSKKKREKAKHRIYRIILLILHSPHLFIVWSRSSVWEYIWVGEDGGISNVEFKSIGPVNP